MTEIGRALREPTAIVSANDQMAFGAMNAARDLGLKIPDDLAVVGFDNIPLSSYFDPPLTTVEIPMYETGAEAMRMLMGLLSGESFDKLKLFQTKLLVRGSTTKKDMAIISLDKQKQPPYIPPIESNTLSNYQIIKYDALVKSQNSPFFGL